MCSSGCCDASRRCDGGTTTRQRDATVQEERWKRCTYVYKRSRLEIVLLAWKYSVEDALQEIKKLVGVGCVRVPDILPGAVILDTRQYYLGFDHRFDVLVRKCTKGLVPLAQSSAWLCRTRSTSAWLVRLVVTVTEAL